MNLMCPPPSTGLSWHLLLLLLLCSELWSYEAPKDKQDIFAQRACPAFLTFTNAAYLAGVTLELPCHCKPQQVQSVVWFFRKHLGGSEETRALSDHHGNKVVDPSDVLHSSSLQSRFAIRLFSLLIFRAATDDSGIYICGSTHKDFFYGYDLDIQEARTLRLSPSVTPESMKKKRTERKALGSAQPQYRVFTSFGNWSVCDRCAVPGEQVRVGLCYVHSRFLHARYRRANQTVVSCGSEAVPKAFSRLTQSRVGAKMEFKSCHQKCPPQAPPPSKIVALMTFLGYSSASMPVQVRVFYLNHPAERLLTMGCPGARANMAVAWDHGTEPIYRSKHLAGHGPSGTVPRLVIDTGHHLVFRPAKVQDSGIYYCWLQGRQTAEIRLLVYAHFGHGQSVISHPDFPAAVRTILTSYAVMTAVFCCLLFIKGAVRYYRDTRETRLD